MPNDPERAFLHPDACTHCDKGGPCQQHDPCKKGGAPDKPDDVHDCLENWRKRLKTAENELTERRAVLDSANSKFKEAFDWEGRLKTWVDNADISHKKAVLVADKLVRLTEVVNRLGRNSDRTTKTIQVLLCLVKGIFDQLYEVTLDGATEDRWGLLKKLQHYVACDSKANEKDQQDAFNCIEMYASKLPAIEALQQPLMKLLLDMLAQADYLTRALASCDSGLEYQITELRGRIVGEHPGPAAGPDEEKCKCKCGEDPPKPGEPPCGVSILYPPQRLLPIAPMPSLPPAPPPAGCPPKPCDPQQQQQQQQQRVPLEKKCAPGNSVYYATLTTLLNQAVETTGTSRVEQADAGKAYDFALAQKVSLEEAVKAAEAAENGK